MFTREHFYIIAACMLAHGYSLIFRKHEFVFDDDIAITRNRHITNTTQSLFQAIRKILVHDFWGQDITNEYSHKSYRPLVSILYHLEYRFFTPQTIAAMVKRINLMFHCGICCLFYDLLRRLFTNIRYLHIHLLAAILFAVHPIHAETVFAGVGRADLLCTFFFICTINQYLDIIEEEKLSSSVLRRKFYVLFGLSLACLLTKEIGIMVLPFCIFLDLITVTIPINPKKEKPNKLQLLIHSNWAMIIRSASATCMIIALISIRLIALGHHLPRFTSEENPVAAHPDFLTRTLTYFYLHGLHFWLLLCPDWLCFDWSHNCITFVTHWLDYRVVFVALVYGFLFRSFVSGTEMTRMAIGFLIIPFLPSSNILPIGFVVAERILYIPSIGYCLLLAIGVHRIFNSHPQLRKAIALFIVTVFILRTNYRAIDWENDFQLFASGVRVCPNNAKIYYNLGQVTASYKNYEKSVEYNTMANKLRPGNPATLNNLANAYRNSRDLKSALEFHMEAIRYDEKYSLGWMNMGVTYIEMGLYEEALNAYMKASEINPSHEKTIFNIGNLYLRLGKHTMAADMYRKAIEINPKSQRARINLIRHLSEYGTESDLLEACDQAEQHLTENVSVLMTIADVFAQKNYNFERIEKLYERIFTLDAKNYMAYGKLANLYHRRNQTSNALKYYKRAIEIHPDFEFTNAYFLDFMKRFNEQYQREAGQKTTKKQRAKAV